MAEPMIEEFSPADFLLRQQGGELWQLLDVREPWEINIASISGTIRIPMALLPERICELDARTATAVLCHSGVRSLRAAAYLADRGFGHVANINGGIDLWSQTVDPTIARY
ncbi:MAG: rhodanese-like domain-containing protein [Gammaproteobacteria bacterium]|nr:rhodanese-like domain-containing protein [Gammaproteobacteria bacterium]MDH4313593.1 rhodanese-like domain-containing protein [Gammaproteobacteria bacterium]MDH5213356.1 rhodanese-like domain-containing protein [Gammaproteobacteria bacterium]MDH5500013.1 rhodanese-like domain-containing protein [Gammaproteobacteria bacterium]